MPPAFADSRGRRIGEDDNCLSACPEASLGFLTRPLSRNQRCEARKLAAVLLWFHGVAGVNLNPIMRIRSLALVSSALMVAICVAPAPHPSPTPVTQAAFAPKLLDVRSGEV